MKQITQLNKHTLSAVFMSPPGPCAARMGFSALVCACVLAFCGAAPVKHLQRNEPENNRPIIGKPLVFMLCVKQMDRVVH